MIDKIMALLRSDARREVLSYLIFGVLTTLVNWLVYFGMTALLRPGLYPRGSAEQTLIYNGSQWTAWLLSVIFAFFTNRRYVFESAEKKGGAFAEFIRFALARIAGYFLFDLIVFNLFVFTFGVRHGLSKILMNILVVIYNYFSSKYLIFRKK